MITTLTIFCVSLGLSLILTPLSTWFGRWGQAMDRPDGLRKTHLKATPRIGGIAIVLSFFGALIGVHFTGMFSLSATVSRNAVLCYGISGLLVFGVGLWDDYHRLNHRIKFLAQVFAASLVYFCGDRIHILSLLPWQLNSVVSYGVTVFWFLIFINAVNLIDGLDGLAAGICFFCALVMTVLTTLEHSYVTAALFAALAGTLLGFLRYNFNPATIFLGDAGSYFLGFVIAAVSLNSSIKSQTSAAILIPILALGVPLFDTVLSPLRRFITGKAMFKPDRGHIHHRIMNQLGLNTRRAVILIYGVTAALCLLSLAISNMQSFQAGLFLIAIGVCAMLFIRKLGYMDYIASDKVIGWLQDIGDVSGFSHDRRSFLNLQIAIGESSDMTDFWQNVCHALERLRFDYAVMILQRDHSIAESHETAGDPPSEKVAPDVPCDPVKMIEETPFSWVRDGVEVPFTSCNPCVFKLELPLINPRSDCGFCILWVEKNIRQDPISHYTLRRVEHLRRSMIGVLENFDRLKHDPSQAASDACEAQGRRMKILVVDNEAVVLMMLEEYLSGDAFEVLTAGDADDALRIVQNTPVDMAIVDIGSARLRGRELCVVLRSFMPDIKIIALVGHPSPSESEICREQGFDGYFTKPFLPEDMLEAINCLAETI